MIIPFTGKDSGDDPITPVLAIVTTENANTGVVIISIIPSLPNFLTSFGSSLNGALPWPHDLNILSLNVTSSSHSLRFLSVALTTKEYTTQLELFLCPLSVSPARR